LHDIFVPALCDILLTSIARYSLFVLTVQHKSNIKHQANKQTDKTRMSEVECNKDPHCSQCLISVVLYIIS